MRHRETDSEEEEELRSATTGAGISEKRKGADHLTEGNWLFVRRDAGCEEHRLNSPNAEVTRRDVFVWLKPASSLSLLTPHLCICRHLL